MLNLKNMAVDDFNNWIDDLSSSIFEEVKKSKTPMSQETQYMFRSLADLETTKYMYEKYIRDGWIHREMFKKVDDEVNT